MRQFLLVLLCITCVLNLQQCAVTRPNPIKNKYQDTVFVFTTPKLKSQVWDNLVDIVAQTGMKFSRLDKDNGLLISEEYSFKGAVTTERCRFLRMLTHHSCSC
jgi:hypothetical protein